MFLVLLPKCPWPQPRTLPSSPSPPIHHELRKWIYEITRGQSSCLRDPGLRHYVIEGSFSSWSVLFVWNCNIYLRSQTLTSYFENLLNSTCLYISVESIDTFSWRRKAKFSQDSRQTRKYRYLQSHNVPITFTLDDFKLKMSSFTWKTNVISNWRRLRFCGAWSSLKFKGPLYEK